MAHGRTVMDLAPGLNVLCGPNNTGKSAVVEALRCLTSNPTPRHVIRHGATEARVEAELEGGWRVAWVRRKAYALYEVFAPGVAEPQVYAKLGRSGVPAEVAALLRMAPVALDRGEVVDVHLGNQREPIFLLDKAGSVLADFLASSTESAHLMAMQDLLRDKTRKAKQNRARLAETQARVRQGLDRLAALPDLSLHLDDARERGRSLEARALAEPVLAARVGRMADLTFQARSLGRKARALALAAPPPDIRPAARLAGRLAEVRALAALRDRARRVLEGLRPLAPPGQSAPAGALAALRREQAALGLQRAASLARATLLAGLAPCPAPPDPGPLARLVRDRAELALRLASARARAALLGAIAGPPQPADPAPLAELVARTAQLCARLAAGAIYLAERDAALAELSGRIAARLAQVGACPLCGGDLDAGRFLGRAGGRADAQLNAQAGEQADGRADAQAGEQAGAQAGAGNTGNPETRSKGKGHGTAGR